MLKKKVKTKRLLEFVKSLLQRKFVNKSIISLSKINLIIKRGSYLNATYSANCNILGQILYWQLCCLDVVNDRPRARDTLACSQQLTNHDVFKCCGTVKYYFGKTYFFSTRRSQIVFQRFCSEKKR